MSAYAMPYDTAEVWSRKFKKGNFDVEDQQRLESCWSGSGWGAPSGDSCRVLDDRRESTHELTGDWRTTTVAAKQQFPRKTGTLPKKVIDSVGTSKEASLRADTCAHYCHQQGLLQAIRKRGSSSSWKTRRWKRLRKNSRFSDGMSWPTHCIQLNWLQ